MRSLKTLSNRELLNRLSKLVKQERNLTLEILPHLIEVENRKIHRSLGYSSMFVYCTDGLGYSESSANRRIYAARAIRKCPGAYDDLREGCVNLGTLALVWRHVTPELLEEIRGKSYRQVQTIASRFNPMIKHRDITRPVAVRVPVAMRKAVAVRMPVQETVVSPPARAYSNGSGGLAPPAVRNPFAVGDPELGEISLRRGGEKLTTNTLFDSCGENPISETPPRPETEPKVETVKMHRVNCLIDDEVMQMLNRCKELLSGKFPCGIDYNTLMKELATDWLEKHDPTKRSERREKRKKSGDSRSANKLNQTGQEKTTQGETGCTKVDSFNGAPKNVGRYKTSRYISPATKDAVYNRDKGQCTYVGSNGKRCDSKWDLEIHHNHIPFALGGDNSKSNLRLLCATHNKLEAERVYGRQHMQKYSRQQE
jgi:hypothetical protein